MRQEQIGIKTPEFISLQFQLAGLGSRATAFIINQLILLVVNALIIISLIILFTGEMDLLAYAGIDSLLLGLTIVGLFIINSGYFIALEYFSGGRTIGKRIVGIKPLRKTVIV